MSGFLDAQRTHDFALTGFDDDTTTRALLSGAFFMVAFFVVLSPAYFADTRVLEGANVWLKPQKFAISLFVHFITLAVLAQLLPRRVRTGPSLAIATYLAIGSLVLEAVYVSVQAARGRRSHFNFETTFEASMYAAMGLGAVLLVLVAIVLGVQIWRKGEASAGLKTGAAVGLIIGAVATLVMAGYMSASGSRWVGAHPIGGGVVPVFGWSREVGDLRPAHFVSMHMMQTLPLIGWAADRLRAPGVIIVWAAALAQLALAGFLFWQALQGRPFSPA
ncbi:MAG: hypothetical protein AAGD92_08130 [Pseudomonadota bacterium]